FTRRVLEAATGIPYGRVATYGQVAAAAGSPRAARAAGRALASNPVPIVVPCHRVIPAVGGVGGYAGGADMKARLLELEGARMGNGAGRAFPFVRAPTGASSKDVRTMLAGLGHNRDRAAQADAQA
ncbi:MAG: methylated-DNA--[protein]-cysteine S-methyltransferase, partial [Actinomycetota bacterium]|nr:methylated-DNA--[protein]-cysteine S-methyltransferase [Actinomycetota bacterium]